MRNSGLTVFLILFSFSFAVSQINYANRLFEENDFEAASKVYEKVLDKDSTDIEAIERLAECYKKLNKYDKAEAQYAKAVKYEKADPESYLNYGQLLKNNNKIRQAREQFHEYVKRKPESLLGKILLQSCEDISKWSSEPSEFQVQNLREINTEYLELSPMPDGARLIFTSDKNYMTDAGGKKSKTPDGTVFSIYVYDSLNKENPISSFSNEINTADNIEGPAFLNTTGDKVFYTKVFSRQRYQVNQMEIHMAHKENDKWTKDNAFDYNDKDYSLTNPVVSPDEKYLFFASDMPGGYGGFDIYVSEKTASGYGEPTNLGDIINTAGNEIPSFFDSENALYFSSNYHPGFGGLDVFRSVRNATNWTQPVNIKSPFNSSKDDLGYVQIDSLTGYFASNRDGGAGLDDIYYFFKKRFTDSSYYTDISGVFVFDTLPLINMTLALLDENDEIVQMVTTNEKGEFSFTNVRADRSYKILIDESPEKVPEEARIYLTNDRYEKIMLIERVQKGLFKFETLKRDEYEGLSLMDEVDDSGRPTLNVKGQLSHKLGDSLIGVRKIFVVDAEGNVVASTVSDHLGQFNFEKLSIDDQYLFRLEEDDPDIDIKILNDNGEVVGRTLKNKDGTYVYHKFTINPSEEPDIRGLFKYGNLPAEKVLLMLMNEEDEVIQITTTNVKGEFEFKGLKSGKSYKIRLDSTQKLPSNANLFLMDKHTGTLMPVSQLANGSFEFKTLAPMAPPELALMEEEDYVIRPMHDMKGQVYKKSGEVIPSGMDVEIRDYNGVKVAVAKTDDKGIFHFYNLPVDDEYLFSLPEEDPDLLIRILNEKNGVIGNAEKNDQNLYVYHKFTINPSKRPDIRGIFKYGNLPANDVNLNLLDENDHLVQVARTNQKGEFKFNGLRGGKTYRVEVDSSEDVPDDANMLLLDEMTGLMLPVSKLANGSFKFETLDPLATGDLALVEEIDDSSVRFTFFAQMFNKLPLELPEGLEIQLVDDDGNVIAIAVTDKFGRFNYEKLPLEDEYLMRIVEDDPNYALRIITAEGKELGVLKRNRRGEFVYNRHEFDNQEALAQNTNPAAGTNGEVKEKTRKDKPVTKADKTTDKKPADKKSANQTADAQPKKSASSTQPVGDGNALSFAFESRTPEQSSINHLNEIAAQMKADQGLKLEIISHTDSWGKADYNQWLSEQRSDSVKNVLIHKGIDAARIKASGAGESQLLNECADGVWCPPEKHAANRRSELRLYR